MRKHPLSLSRPLAALAAAALSMLSAPAAVARPELWVHDSAGLLATVDVPTGSVTLIGDMGVVMTDVAFAPDGRLFGISFTALYEIDPVTAIASLIGNHGINNGNALVFAADGTLYAASGVLTALYELDPTTGAATVVGNLGASSGGDLAFAEGGFYMATGAGQLVSIDLGPPATGTVVGSSGFSNVFGLATADDGVLYGVAGTSVFSVDTATGAGTLVSDYGGQGLGASYGSSFRSEALQSCPDVPRTGCFSAGKGSLKIKEAKPGSEKLGLSLKGFSAQTMLADLGDPVAGDTRYEVCLYDEQGDLVAGLGVPRAGVSCGAKPCWKAKGASGYAYKDPLASASGVKKLALAAGPAGKGKIGLSAANKIKKGQAALPIGIAAELADDASVTAQLAASGAACFEALLDVTKADASQLQAKSP